jgi:hypothetical protein
MRTLRRRKETLRHESAYISVNNNTNLKIEFFLYTVYGIDSVMQPSHATVPLSSWKLFDRCYLGSVIFAFRFYHSCRANFRHIFVSLVNL